jgi:glutaredoxin
MQRVEIYGRVTAAATIEAERFCIRMRYPHILRDIEVDLQARMELKQRKKLPGSLPQIFIGLTQIGTLRDLIDMEPFVVQQHLGE